MDLAEVTNRVREAVGDDAGLGKTLKFDFGPVGKIFLNGASVPNEVTNEDNAADCTIQLSWEDFEQMVAGKLDPTMAFMQGKLKVLGDMAVAMKLQPILARLK